MNTNEILLRAQTFERAGRAQEAESLYRQIVAANPGHHPAWHALGILVLNQGDLAQAARCLEAAIAADGKVALYHRNLGEMYRRLGRLEQSIQCGQRAVKLAPADVDAHYNLALVHGDAGHFEQAIQTYRQVLELNPRHGLSWNNLGSVLERNGDKEGAEQAYATAVEINPEHAEAQNNLGAIRIEYGKLDEARAGFEAAIAAQPAFIEAHLNLSSLKRYTADDPQLAVLEQIYAQRAALPEPARIRVGFTLGKALDDLGQYDRAFAAYEEANRLQHALQPVNESRADALLARIMAVFDAEFFAARTQRVDTDPQRTPIFIVGMPRSGTTLLEQILCSHSSVFGAGELSTFGACVTEATRATSQNAFIEGVHSLSDADLKRLGDHYLREVWQLEPDSAFITDKMPANFFYLGLIHLALPHAKIIHAMRDPMDSCFSCYSRLFRGTMEFAYDQGTLGRYYARYMTLMRHWHAVLPAGSILDLSYEALVADTETQARRILAFVGLPWDDNCLNFHENERPVKTASLAQVRRPIYNSSVARWTPFARHLRPLFDLVKDFRAADAPTPDSIMQAPIQSPSDANTRLNARHAQGVEHYQQQRFVEALACYEQVLAERPDLPGVLNSKGFALQDLGQMEAARACFEHAVALAPQMNMARLNLALAQLKLGDWENGWENYEVRWTGSAEATRKDLKRPACPLPQWAGETGTEQQSLLVIVEQGFGDTFQFARFIELACARFAKVGFACSAPLMRLMEWSFGDRVVMLGQMPASFDGWDWQCPLMSLPRAFRTRPDTVPQALPYLRVPEVTRKHWRGRLENAAPGRLRIGIAWAGRPAYQYDARRSIAFELIAPLLDTPGVTWVSLQKWAAGDKPQIVPAGVFWLDWTGELGDFADTAALVANLDLVISIDSALVHLAGALDKPVWMLDRFDNEWRWLHRRLDSPWYPRLRIFRQPEFGAWSPVVDAVRAELATITPAAPSAKPADDAYQLYAQGIAAYRGGQLALAIERIGAAIALRGDIAVFHCDLTELCRQAGRLDQALTHGERAVALDPQLAAAHSNLGVVCFDRGDLERAEACQLRALALDPRCLSALNNLGSIERQRKQPDAALSWYDKVLAVAPDHIESLSNRGAVLLEQDRAQEALAALQRAIALAPRHVEALSNLGLACNLLERYGEAQTLLKQALAIRPDYFNALLGLARNHQEQDQLPEAEATARRTVELAPDKTEAWCMLGSVLTAQARAHEAETAYRRALELDPTAVDAARGLGHLQMENGALDEARALFEAALARDENDLSTRFHLAQAAKVRPEDDNFAALLRRAEAVASGAETLSSQKRISLHFALGKCFDDTRRYSEAFPHFVEGCRLKRATFDYDARQMSEQFAAVRRFFDAANMQRLRGGGRPSRLPIFVLGMPRSGTTLTEQIIASHPDVHGAGELRDLMTIAQQPLDTGAALPYPHNLAELTTARLTTWADDYLRRLQNHNPEARFITDKMPANFFGIGLIHLMLPGAKIIHVKRNPVDTCISNFTRLFNQKQEHSYDLAELGSYYADYARLMQHWREVLPAGSFFEVQYEDIVADMEGQARRLIDYCELPWDDACLAFHKNKRSIRTASLVQVRQPIYSGSVERWRHYEAFLAPLLEALGDWAPKG